MIFVRHGQSEFNVAFGLTRQDPGIEDPGITATGARQIAITRDFLADHPKIESISYPFHPSHPQYELAKRQMGAGSTLVALTPKGGKQAAFALADALAIIAISNNLGDAKSIISHPATTTHQRFTPEEKMEMDVTDGLLRLSVGLEDTDDLIADLSFGLDQV